jgi:O-antigen/teichoic acid export membrane protein
MRAGRRAEGHPMKLGKNFMVYLGSSVVSGALPLALMPFLTGHLTPAQYGVMVTVTTVIALIGPVVNWATTAYLSVQYHKTSSDALGTLLSSILVIPVANTAVLVIGFTFLRHVLARWLGIPTAWSYALPLLAAAMLLPQMAQTILAMRGRPLGFAAYEVGAAVIGFVGTIALVVLLGFGWEGRIIATAVASVLMSCVAAGWLFRRGLLAWRLSPAETGMAFRFGGGGVVHDLANQALRLGDRLLIVALAGQAAVGSSAVAVQWSSIMLTILAALNRAWMPFLFSALSSAVPGWAERLVRQTYLVWGALFLLLIAFNVATPIGYALLVNERYHQSMSAVIWLTIGYFFNGIYLTVVDYIFYLKKTHILAMITTFNLLLNTALAYAFIQRFGPIGAAMAFAVTAAIVMGLTFMVSYRLHPMPWVRSIVR